MADFFDNLKDFVSETAEIVSKKTGEVAEIVVQKTEKTVEVQKLKSQIHVMKRNNDRDYRDIGKMVYDRFKNGEEVDPQFAELCEVIVEREDAIEAAKETIADLKGFDVCSDCGAHVEPGAKYCSGCGAKAGDEAEFEEE